MAIILTSSHPKFLWPGIHGIFGRSYEEHPVEWTDLVDSMTSEKAYEEIVQVTPFGVVPVKEQTKAVTFDSETQGPVTRAVHLAYALGYIVSHEELQDNLYLEVSAGRAASLAYVFRQTKERVVANLYNFAFASSGHNGADGVPMCSTAHPNTSGGTYSNALAIPAQLSEASLEDLLIQIMQAQDDRGNLISLVGSSLHVSPSEYFNATRILKSQYRVDTANNDISAIQMTGQLPMGCKVNHYFTSARPWFIRTRGIAKGKGLALFQREKLSFMQDNDFDTRNAKAMGYERYSVAWADPRAIFGSNAS